MIVYHFINELYGLKDIRERRLKISNIADLNDPFEFIAAETSNQRKRHIINGVRDELAKSRGIICFSRHWQNPVQWSHYADGHKGLCLGFEAPSSLLCQVSYIASKIPWPSQPWPWPDAVKQYFFSQLVATKFSHWSYEDEYRLFCSMETPAADGYHYINFSASLKLVKVLVGARSTLTRDTLAAALGDLSADVEQIKVRPAFRSFRIVKQKDLGLWP